MKIYEVCAKCGHVGKGNYVEKIFAVYANNGSDAATAVRWYPRVKHHHKDAIIYVHEIDKKRYNEISLINEKDPYFKCHNIQDQRSYNEPIILKEKNFEIFENYKELEQNNKEFYCGKKKLRNPKKYMNRFYKEEIVAVC